MIDVTSARAHFRPASAAPITMRRSSSSATSAPDIWVGTRAEIADHVLSMSRRLNIKKPAGRSVL